MIIQQLKDLKGFEETGVLTTDQFEEQKGKLCVNCQICNKKYLLFI